jgi:NAD(P)H-flavin reductase
MEGWRYTPLVSVDTEDAARRNEVSALERIAADHADLSGWDAYVTGPQGIVSAVRSLLLRQGLPAERCFAEFTRYF